MKELLTYGLLELGIVLISFLYTIMIHSLGKKWDYGDEMGTTPALFIGVQTCILLNILYWTFIN